MEKILAYFEHHVKNESTFQNRRRLVFTQASLIGSTALIIFIISHFAQKKTYAGLIDLVGLLILIINLFTHKFYGNYKWSMGVLISTILFIVATQHMIAPPSLQSNTLWFTIVAFGINFLFTKTYSKYGMGILMITAIISEYIHQNGFLNLNEFSPQESTGINLTSVIISLIASYFLGKTVMRSERETLNRLEQKNKESIALSDEYAGLVNVLSHDLSNQIFVINLQTTLLLKNLTEKDKEFNGVSMIQKISDEMAKLITQIKQYKAHDDGKIKLTLEKVNPIIAINSSLEYFKQKLQDKEIDLYFTPPRTIAPILAEPVTLVSCVLNNVLTNAIKFSRTKGTIKIYLEEKKEHIIIKIIDSGIGIPDEILTNLFSAKKSTSRPGTNGEEGTGFGMPILKMYMDKYGADVEVKTSTQDNPGTKFNLIFKKAKNVTKNNRLTNSKR